MASQMLVLKISENYKCFGKNWNTCDVVLNINEHKKIQQMPSKMTSGQPLKHNRLHFYLLLTFLFLLGY